MKKTLSYIILSLFLLFGVIACNPVLKDGDSCGFVLNSFSQRISWQQADLPITFYLHESMNEQPQAKEMRDSLQRAIDYWNKQFFVEVFRLSPVYIGYQTNNSPDNDRNNIIYYIKDWNSDMKKQAVTTVYWQENLIYEADIKINANYRLYFGEDENVPKNNLDFQSLMVHELGHVLGLAHYEDNDSVMKTILPQGLNRRFLGESDRQALSCEYKTNNKVM